MQKNITIYIFVYKEMGVLLSLKSKPERAFRLISLMNDHWFEVSRRIY